MLTFSVNVADFVTGHKREGGSGDAHVAPED